MRVPVRDLAARHGIRPSKARGQHFLVDPHLADAIVADARIRPGDRVVEIGAGLGSLTVAIAAAGAREVLAIEIDRAVVDALREVVVDLPTVRVLQADATAIDWSVTLGAGPWVLCANLPYNVGTRIVMDVLERVPAVPRLLVMLQREVGERLVAGPGDEAYGTTSVRVAYHADAALVRRVPPEVFWPQPSVGSVLVRLDRWPRPPVEADPEALWRVVDEAFSQRRKTMRGALRRLGFDAPARALEAAQIPASARPEELGLVDFARLAAMMAP